MIRGRNDIILRICAETGLSKHDATLALYEILNAIRDALARGDRVDIAGFGTFFLQERAARLGRNPRTGERIEIYATRQPKFKAYRSLLGAVGGYVLRGHGGGGGAGPLASVGPPTPKPQKKPRAKKAIKDYEIIDVFFGTNRKAKNKTPIKYGFRLSESLSFGRVKVSIPKKRDMATLPRPKWWQKEDPKNHIAIITIRSKSENKFFSELSSSFTKLKRKDIFVFIHGYRVKFEQAARRTAQLAYDLNFDGIPVMFSWPSGGELASYFKDGNRVERTFPKLMDFLVLLAKRSGAERIHIVAHSMGSRALANAFLQMAASIENTEKNVQFSQVILAAPDIDEDVFADLSKHIGRFSGRVTLYASSNDKALFASKAVHGNRRAGDTIGGVTIVDGVDTIDASKVSTDFLRHAYFAESRSVVSDIFQLIRHGHPPADRNLRRAILAGKEYWEIP